MMTMRKTNDHGPARKGAPAQDVLQDDDLDFDPAKLETATDVQPDHQAKPMTQMNENNGQTNAGIQDGPEIAVARRSEILDPFDPSRLRLTQDFTASVGVEKALVTIPVRKPAKEWFFMVHPDEAYRIETAVIELKEARELYLVDPSLWTALAGESTFGPRLLVTAMNRQHMLFLVPIRLPGVDGKLDEWNRSLLEAVNLATGRWVRVAANMSAGHYDVLKAAAQLPGPEWPALPFKEILGVAFKDRLIESADHPVLKQLRGDQ
jgi:hypothetical protein